MKKMVQNPKEKNPKPGLSLKERVGLILELATFIAYYLARILSFERVKYELGHKTELKKKLRDRKSVV